MSGLIGIVGDAPQDELDEQLKGMARALEHEDWYQTHLYTGEGIGLGRVSLGILNPQPQPIWNEDETLCIVMEGEVYDYDDEKQRLVERGHRFRVNSDPEYVLHLYEEYGQDFALKLNGAFVAAIWDTKRRRLLIVNDRFGLVPLFYAHLRGRLLFAGGVRAILASVDFTPRVDAVAIAQFLTLEHVLGDRTLLEDVVLLPPAALVVYEDSQLTSRSFWDFQFREEYDDHDLDWYLDRWTFLVRQAVERRTRTGRPFGVSLSGGLDSRTVLAMIDRDRYPVHALTFGLPGSDDVRLARELSRAVGAASHYFELKPDFLAGVADEGVRLTDGMNSCKHMHGLAPIRAMAKHVKVLFTGSVGDALTKDVEVAYRLLPTARDDDVFAKAMLRSYSKGVPGAEHGLLFSEGFFRKIQGVVFEGFRGVLAESRAALPANKRKHYAIRESNRRRILEGKRLLQSQCAVRTPFYDNDLFDFMLNLPPGLRLDSYLYVRGFSKAFPELAKIPWATTGLPLSTCMRDLRIRADRQIRWRLRASGLKWVPERKHRPYADYDAWMRTVLRSWVEETLLSKQALERGYFRPDYLHGLVAEHMAGANHARKLGVLLTLELWHRLFLDRGK